MCSTVLPCTIILSNATGISQLQDFHSITCLGFQIYCLLFFYLSVIRIQGTAPTITEKEKVHGCKFRSHFQHAFMFIVMPTSCIYNTKCCVCDIKYWKKCRTVFSDRVSLYMHILIYVFLRFFLQYAIDLDLDVNFSDLTYQTWFRHAHWIVDGVELSYRLQM